MTITYLQRLLALLTYERSNAHGGNGSSVSCACVPIVYSGYPRMSLRPGVNILEPCISACHLHETARHSPQKLLQEILSSSIAQHARDESDDASVNQCLTGIVSTPRNSDSFTDDSQFRKSLCSDADDPWTRIAKSKSCIQVVSIYIRSKELSRPSVSSTVLVPSLSRTPLRRQISPQLHHPRRVAASLINDKDSFFDIDRRWVHAYLLWS